MGATGLNALMRAPKKIHRTTRRDTSREAVRGISSSPLVVDDIVIVSVGGTLGLRRIDRRWTGLGHGGSYSSPHLVTIDGVLKS